MLMVVAFESHCCVANHDVVELLYSTMFSERERWRRRDKSDVRQLRGTMANKERGGGGKKMDGGARGGLDGKRVREERG